MDIESVEKLAAILNSSSASELIVTNGDFSVKLRRQMEMLDDTEEKSGAFEEEGIPDEPAAAPDASLLEIRSAMVGIFHEVEGIRPGASVKEKQVLGLVESMKLMNEIVCRGSGVVQEVFVEDGQPVEYDQVLMTLREGA